MQFAILETLTLITDHEIRAANPETSFPPALLPEHVAALGIVPIQYDPEPDADPMRVQPGALRSEGSHVVRGWVLEPETVPEIQARLTRVLDGHLDAVAGERHYDNRWTCSLRAAFPEGEFFAEGAAYFAWMEKCNFKAYQIMAAVKVGLRPVPTESELIAEMPLMVWPPSPIPTDAV